MNKEQIISQLCNLREHCESMIDPAEQDCIWAYDVEALDNAIDMISDKAVRKMTDVQKWLISGVIVLAIISVSVMYTCMVVSGHKRR